MIVVVCPGQGSQTPGFLEPWLELAQTRSLLEEYSDAAGVDLLKHGTVSDESTIRDTRIAQPLIVAASLLAWHALSAPARNAVGGLAGHSVGELAALAAAGVIADDDAIRIVGERGRAMADAAALAKTGMSAVIGGVESELISLAAEHQISPANFNGGGQIVMAGLVDNLAAFADAAPRGVRVVPLSVAGAFHTRFMEPARDRVKAVIGQVEQDRVNDPRVRLWSNSDGSIVSNGQLALDLITAQVTSPVRWDRCMDSFQEAGITGIIELAPAGALAGLAKRGLRGVPSIAVKTPEDIVSANEMLTAGSD